MSDKFTVTFVEDGKEYLIAVDLSSILQAPDFYFMTGTSTWYQPTLQPTLQPTPHQSIDYNLLAKCHANPNQDPLWHDDHCQHCIYKK